MRKVLLLLFILPLIHGFCHTSSGRVDKTVTGRTIPVCEYQGLDILDGSHFKTANCMDCNCDNGKLSCCGFGINSGIYMPPVGCKIIADGCDPIFVLETDQTRDCTTGKPINVRDKPAPIKPVFPGLFPMSRFPQLRMPDPSSMLQNGMNYKYNVVYKNNLYGNGLGDTTGNSLQDFLYHNGLMG